MRREHDEPLIEALGSSQRLGFLGDRPIDEVIDHARHFVTALGDVHGRVIDLGSGGGVPGLVVATDRPDLHVTMIDRRTKRTDFLLRMVRRLGLDEQVDVLAMDVEDALRYGYDGFDGAVARGFGPPDTTLSYAARFVRTGGLVVISEPPAHAGGVDRWDDDLLDRTGVIRGPDTAFVACFTRRRRAPHSSGT